MTSEQLQLDVKSRNHSLRGARGAQSVKRPTLDFGSSHDLTVLGIKSNAWDSLSLSLPLPTRTPFLSLSLSLSLSLKIAKLKQTNKTKQNKNS